MVGEAKVPTAKLPEKDTWTNRSRTTARFFPDSLYHLTRASNSTSCPGFGARRSSCLPTFQTGEPSATVGLKLKPGHNLVSKS